MKSNIKWFLLLSSIVAFAACGGSDDDTECGDNTTLEDGVCVADVVTCGPGSTLNQASGECEVDGGTSLTCGTGTSPNAAGTECVADNDGGLTCGEGTSPNAAGTECVADGGGSDVTCGDNTTLEDGICVPDVPSLCGEDTVEEDGSCIPAHALCEEGEVWTDGACVDANCSDDQVWTDGACAAIGTYCGDGTILMDGTCELVDPFTDVSVPEGEANNNPFTEGGTPVQFELAAENETVLIGGVIDAPTVTDDAATPDLDGYVFAGEAGQRIRIETTSIGAPQASALLMYAGENEDITYQRFLVPVSSRNAAREVVLPADGAYLLVGMERSMVEFMLDDDLESARVGDLEGNEAYSYTMGVTLLEPVDATVLTVPVEEIVDLNDIAEFTLAGNEGDVFSFGFNPGGPDVYPALWGTDADFNQVLFGAGEFVHPGGDVSIFADFFVSFTNYMDAQLTIEQFTVADATLPLEEVDAEFGENGTSLFSFEITELSAVTFELIAGTDSVAIPNFRLMDGDFVSIFGYDYNLADLSMAMEPGTYFVEVADTSEETEGVFTYTFDLFAEPIADLGMLAADSPLADTVTLANEESAWFTFGTEELGFTDLSVSPVESNVAFSFYDGVVFSGQGDDFGTLFNDEGAASPEEHIALLPIEQYFFRVDALSESADATVNIEASFEPVTVLDEVEPNDVPENGQIFTAPEEDGILILRGEFASDVTQDCFTMTFGPGVFTASTNPDGDTPVGDTVIELFDAEGESIGYNDDINYGGGNYFSEISEEVPAGDYTICARGYGEEQGGYYIQLTVDQLYNCFPTETDCSGNDLILCDDEGEWDLDNSTECLVDNDDDDDATCGVDPEFGAMCDVLCEVGEVACSDDGTDTLLTCADDQYAWDEFGCPIEGDLGRCLDATDDDPAMCEMICTPTGGTGVCSDDATSVIACADDGLSMDTEVCNHGCATYGEGEGQVDRCSTAMEGAIEVTLPFVENGIILDEDHQIIYTFTPDSDLTYVFTTSAGPGEELGDSFLSLFNSFDDYPDDPIAYDDDINYLGGNAYSEIEFNLVSGTQYWIVVKGVASDDIGSFVLTAVED